jgi:aminoglycoside phosphotransferase (APT) family kinase protein
VTETHADTLKPALERILGKIAGYERRPHVYRTSFSLDALDVRLADGTELELLVKGVGRGGLDASIRNAKPAFLYDPLREVEVYEHVLTACALGTARFYGMLVEPGAGRGAFVLERVSGSELWQIGETEIWREAARWLARLHERLAPVRAPRLLRYDEKLYRRFLARAVEFTLDPSLQSLVTRYDEIVRRLEALPTTFIHGEFYPSNVLVERVGRTTRICPVDWEMAALGPGVLDLAALSAGDWSEDEAEGFVAAYREALTQPPAEADLREALEAARVQLAVQWLGWSPGWIPPPEHAQPWLEVALRSAERLGL